MKAPRNKIAVICGLFRQAITAVGNAAPRITGAEEFYRLQKFEKTDQPAITESKFFSEYTALYPGKVEDQEDRINRGIRQLDADKAKLAALFEKTQQEPGLTKESLFDGIDRVRRELELLLTDRSNGLFIFLDDSEWKQRKYKDLVCEKAGANWFEISPAERRQRAHDLGAEIGKEYEDFEVTGAVFEKLIEPKLIQPTFVTHLPKELVPLAKLSPDDPTTVEVFECCINGQEVSPGYTEQNDPIAQRTTLEHQAGGEQQKLDEDFLVALEHGMPPAGGIGIGIDRLCMMLLGQESIRDVILFPQLKPK